MLGWMDVDKIEQNSHKDFLKINTFFYSKLFKFMKFWFNFLHMASHLIGIHDKYLVIEYLIWSE